MPVLLTAEPVLVNATTTRFQTVPEVIDPLTATIETRLRRTTTAAPRAWSATGRCNITIVITADGIEQRFTGSRRGGILKERDGTTDVIESIQTVTPTFGFFGTRSAQMRRLGQRATVYTVHVEIDRIAGSVNTLLDFSTTIAGAPLSAALTDAITDTTPGPGEWMAVSHGTREFASAGIGWIGDTEQFSWTDKTSTHLLIRSRGARGSTAVSHQAGEIVWHKSVVHDTATAAEEDSGDGTISLSHTAGGTTNRCVLAFVGGSVNSGVRHSGPPTYGGTAMTEQWDAFDNASTGNLNAGNALAIGATLTGAQTVTSTLTGTGGTLSYHTLAVVSTTDTDQTTPVGTPVFNAEDTPDATSPFGLTVTGAGADDLIYDHLQFAAGGAPTIGANQTATLTHDNAGGSRYMRVSRQAGSLGTSMDWTGTGTAMYGAIAVKPSVAGGASIVPIIGSYFRERRS